MLSMSLYIKGPGFFRCYPCHCTLKRRGFLMLSMSLYIKETGFSDVIHVTVHLTDGLFGIILVIAR